MKTYNWIFVLAFISLGVVACTPMKDEIVDFSHFEITKVELGADHRQLIADGMARITLNPMLYQEYTYVTNEGKDSTVYGKIPVDRIAEGTVQYFMEDGTQLENEYYSTTDLSKSEIGFYVVANGIKSNVFNVSIREPFSEDIYDTIVYPIVFHVIQDKINVDLGQGVGSDIIYNTFETIAHVFARQATTSPNSADTRIRFQLAEYDPDGKLMTEKGINRYPMSTEELGNLDPELIKNNPEICWDYKRYLNIWIVDDFDAVTTPRYILNTADLSLIEGIQFEQKSLEEIEAGDYNLTDIGLVYDAEAFATEDVGYVTELGRFFGLLDTDGEDYCDDTFTYETYKEPWNTELNASNSRLKISSDGLLFYSVNIMDESTYGNTISMDQVKRIRTITEYCPHRWAYKSKWAFTGKND